MFSLKNDCIYVKFAATKTDINKIQYLKVAVVKQLIINVN